MEKRKLETAEINTKVAKDDGRNVVLSRIGFVVTIHEHDHVTVSLRCDLLATTTTDRPSDHTRRRTILPY